MKRLTFLLGVFLSLLPSRFHAQTVPPSPDLPSSRTEAPYLLPQTIFVGDPGRLVVPLGQVFAGAAPFVSQPPENRNESPDLEIRRVELERRDGISRLLIDFVPYAPGLVSFPPLTLAADGEGPLTITGLEAQVASILNPSQTSLSEAALPMAVPGTSFLVYGTAVSLILLLFLWIGVSIWTRRHFGEIRERLRRRYLIRAMKRFLRRLEHGDIVKSGSAGAYLTLLSGEFREFLSVFTGSNCRSLSAGEFLELPLRCAVEGNSGNSGAPELSPLNPAFLCRLFRGWDTLRFSGLDIDRIDLFRALRETASFVAALDAAEREKPLLQTARKSPPAPDTDEAEEGGGTGETDGENHEF